MNPPEPRKRSMSVPQENLPTFSRYSSGPSNNLSKFFLWNINSQNAIRTDESFATIDRNNLEIKFISENDEKSHLEALERRTQLRKPSLPSSLLSRVTTESVLLGSDSDSLSIASTTMKNYGDDRDGREFDFLLTDTRNSSPVLSEPSAPSLRREDRKREKTENPM